jgi:hypothetical protein
MDLRGFINMLDILSDGPSILWSFHGKTSCPPKFYSTLNMKTLSCIRIFYPCSPILKRQKRLITIFSPNLEIYSLTRSCTVCSESLIYGCSSRQMSL